MRSAMSHQNKNLVFFQAGKFVCNGLDHIQAVLFAGKQRIAKGNGVKILPVGKGVLFHKIVFNTIDHMSWLNKNISDSISAHLLHGLFYRIYMDLIPVLQFSNDHFAGPCPVKGIIRKGCLHFFFNSVNGYLAGIMVAGSEAYSQNCFFSVFSHDVVSSVMWV